MTRNAQRPIEPPRRRTLSGSLRPVSVVPLAAAAILVAAGVIWLGGREAGVGGPSPTPAPSASAITAEATPSPSPVPTAPATSSPTPEPPVGCLVSARIVLWEGAAGSRIATVELKNNGPADCTLAAVARPELIDGNGRGLALGASPEGDPGTIVLVPGATAHGLVRVANVCLAEPPAPPVTILFDLGDGQSITAQPVSPDDVTLPSCNGRAQPSEIEMEPWTP